MHNIYLSHRYPLKYVLREEPGCRTGFEELEKLEQRLEQRSAVDRESEHCSELINNLQLLLKESFTLRGKVLFHPLFFYILDLIIVSHVANSLPALRFCLFCDFSFVPGLSVEHNWRKISRNATADIAVT